MTVYDIPNVTVEPMGEPVFRYRIRTLDGYVIKLSAYEELEYKTVAILLRTYDFSLVQIVPIGELPDGYVINGDVCNDKSTKNE